MNILCNSKTQEKTADFISVVLWGKQAENTAQYMVKGSQVAISGRLSVRTYDAKDGTKRYVTEVVADMFNGIQFLSKNNYSSSNTFAKNNDNLSGWVMHTFSIKCKRYHSVGCLFTLLIVSFDAQKFLILMKSSLSMYPFISYALGVIS